MRVSFRVSGNKDSGPNLRVAREGSGAQLCRPLHIAANTEAAEGNPCPIGTIVGYLLQVIAYLGESGVLGTFYKNLDIVLSLVVDSCLYSVLDFSFCLLFSFGSTNIFKFISKHIF